MKSKLLCSMIMLFIMTSLSSQESRKTVILYNVVPLSVELIPDGTIKTIYGRADHFFAGYQLVQRENYFSNDPKANEEYANMENDVIVSTDVNNLRLDSQLATLNKSTIASLDKIKNMLFLEPNKKIMLTSYTVNPDNKRGVILLRNRLASILSYLDIMGVNKERIVLDTKTQEGTTDYIIASEVTKSELVLDKE